MVQMVGHRLRWSQGMLMVLAAFKFVAVAGVRWSTAVLLLVLR